MGTKITANPKTRFGSYLHVALKYCRFEIFKIILKWLQEKKFDWKNLKDKQERSAYDLLKDETFHFELYHFPEKGLEKLEAGEEKDKEMRQKFLELLESNM